MLVGVGDAEISVVQWIYGGGYEVGDTHFAPGNTIVERSIATGQPVIYVSANYRGNGTHGSSSNVCHV